nr:histidine kinase dimerization/phospho-acceptor domain-containing protein [Sphingomicrobium astaxanthinifaciens]
MVAALAVIRSERAAVPLGVRSAAARAVAGRALDPDLLQLFAEDELAVAAPVLAAADPDAATREALVAAASGDTRTFLTALWPDAAPAAGADDITPPPAESGREGRRLGAVVEQLKAARDRLAGDVAPDDEDAGAGAGAGGAAPDDAPAPEAAAGDPGGAPGAAPPAAPERVTAFAWEAGADGAIRWVEGAPRAALIGKSLFAESSLAALVGARAPFRDIEIDQLGGLPGRWCLTGSPQHDEDSGRFLGYRGRARRADLAPARAARAASPAAPAAAARTVGLPQDPATLRELVHEIKTPLNAIIGFAEIIDGQYLGPAHRRYRERAAEIVAQARILLDAIRDLDFAARLQSRDRAPTPRSLADVLAELREPLEAKAARAGAVLDLDTLGEPGGAGGCTTDGALAARLIERLLAALVEVADEGERLAVRAAMHGEACRLEVALPARLAATAPEDLVDPALVVDTSGKALLGTGFSLRLVRGLARVGGGELDFADGRARLDLPRAS